MIRVSYFIGCIILFQFSFKIALGQSRMIGVCTHLMYNPIQKSDFISSDSVFEGVFSKSKQIDCGLAYNYIGARKNWVSIVSTLGYFSSQFEVSSKQGSYLSSYNLSASAPGIFFQLLYGKSIAWRKVNFAFGAGVKSLYVFRTKVSGDLLEENGGIVTSIATNKGTRPGRLEIGPSLGINLYYSIGKKIRLDFAISKPFKIAITNGDMISKTSDFNPSNNQTRIFESVTSIKEFNFVVSQWDFRIGFNLLLSSKKIKAQDTFLE